VTFAAGQIVLVDWRDALPSEPGKRRPAVVIEDRELFDDSYPNLILVPLAEDPHLAVTDLAVAILPTAENGCTKPSYALAHHVTTTSKRRITPTPSRITPAQLDAIRRRVAISIGLEQVPAASRRREEGFEPFA
jgi:mRNA-degrading endonuclease toxin of MazEF toxin-antitoxin module